MNDFIDKTCKDYRFFIVFLIIFHRLFFFFSKLVYCPCYLSKRTYIFVVFRCSMAPTSANTCQISVSSVNCLLATICSHIISTFAKMLCKIIQYYIKIKKKLIISKQISKLMRTPFVKFLNHTCSYIIFLILVFIATNRDGSGNPFLDASCSNCLCSVKSIVSLLIFIWVLGMFFHECRQMWREGVKNYVTDWWNWMDSALIALYLASYAIQLFTLIKVQQYSEKDRQTICFFFNDTDTRSCRELRCEVDRQLNNWTVCSAGKSKFILN